MSYFISDTNWAEGFDARIDLDGTAVCLHSRGGATGGRPARNTDYSRALETILRRLHVADDGLQTPISAIFIDSLPARRTPKEARLLVSRKELAGHDTKSAAKLIRSKVREWGKHPGSSGGNSTRAIRIETEGLSTAALRAKLKLMTWVDDDDVGLTASEQRRVQPSDIHKAVERLLSGEDAPNFAPSRDYDVLCDDGSRLAPKKVFGLALEEALGIDATPYHFSAGWSQPSFQIIQNAGYAIVPKSSASAEDVIDALAELPTTDADREMAEGDLKLVSHLKRERARGLARRKRAAFIAKHGNLFCERCGFVPADHYPPEVAQASIEVHHHKTQLKDMGMNHKTKLSDLRCLCANCHRVTHRELARGIKYQFGK